MVRLLCLFRMFRLFSHGRGVLCMLNYKNCYLAGQCVSGNKSMAVNRSLQARRCRVIFSPGLAAVGFVLLDDATAS